MLTKTMMEWEGKPGSRSIKELPLNAFWHKVQPRDTISELALEYYGSANVVSGVDVIRELNPFLHMDRYARMRKPTDIIYPGDFLAIPTLKHPLCAGFEKERNTEPPADPTKLRQSVLQDWVQELPFQQQSALLMAIRWADGLPDFHAAKDVARAYRACVLKGAFIGRALTPDDDGDKYMDAKIINSIDWQKVTVYDFFTHMSQLPEHYLTHLYEGTNLLGIHHPNSIWRQRWKLFYEEACEKRRMMPEPPEHILARLNDRGREGWGR